MNGSSLVSSTIIAQPGPRWQVVATADFNGDGRTDIVVQNQDGTVGVWQMNGATIASSAIVAEPGSGWHVVGAGYYGGGSDGGILLQDDSGDAAIWQMNGATLASSALIGSVPVNWQTIGQGTTNFINGNASTGTLAATPLNDEFIFTATSAGAHVITGFDPFNDMIQLSAAQFGSYAGVQGDTGNVGGSAVISLGGGATLTLQGVLASQLTARNFLLG